MIAIDPAMLARVCGGVGAQPPEGPNRTEVTEANGRKTYTARTDRAYCEDLRVQQCKAANTSWFWGLDKQAAAACTLQHLPECKDLK